MFFLVKRRFDCGIEDVFELEDEIARETFAALQGRLLGPRGQMRGSALARDVEAYELYLRGRYRWNWRLPQELEIAADCFEAAVARAPEMARGHAALADCSVTPLGSQLATTIERQCVRPKTALIAPAERFALTLWLVTA